MSSHPNVILMVLLTPDDLARKTYRAILEENGIDPDDSMDPDVKIGGQDYNHFVAESDYEDDYQISCREGDLVFFDLVTYGYGEVISWANLEAQKNALEEWAKGICERHKCSYRIEVTANYW